MSGRPREETRPCRFRYRLTKIAVDTAAGPYQNHTVVFLGSEKGIILKFLARIGSSGFLNDSLFLEEISVYNPEKCSYDGVEDKRIMGLQLDKASNSLFVAFSTCVIKVPLGRCERHGKCKKTCIASRDPYCGWVKEGGSCAHLSLSSRYGATAGECQGPCILCVQLIARTYHHHPAFCAQPHHGTASHSPSFSRFTEHPNITWQISN